MHVPRGLRFCGAVFVSAVLVLVAALIVGFQIGPEHSWLFALAEYAPYPIYLLPAVAAVATSLILTWPWRIAAATALLLVSTVVMGFRFGTGEPSPGTIRFMTFNVKDYVTVRQPHGLDRIGREIVRQDPDVFVLQDASTFWQTLQADSARSLAVFGTRETFRSGQYVVASRFPLRDCIRRDIPSLPESQGYVSCRVLGPNGDFDVVATHFMTPRFWLAAARRDPLSGIDDWRENVSDRMTQAAQLAADMPKHQRPVIVAGDLNAPGPSLVVRTLLDAGLRDAFSVAGTGYGYTWGHSLRTGFSFLRLDRILVGPDFAVADCFVGVGPSPHRPVIADLRLKSRGTLAD